MAALNVPLSLKFQIGPHESEQTDGRTVGPDVRAHCKKLCKEDMYVCPLNRDIYILHLQSPGKTKIFRIERKVGY